MSTVLVFVAIPAAVIGVVASLVLASGDRSRKSRRYRPGRPYDFQPIWFLASPEQVSAPQVGSEGSHPARSLTGGQTPAIGSGFVEGTAGQRVLPGPTGGASDRW